MSKYFTRKKVMATAFSLALMAVVMSPLAGFCAVDSDLSSSTASITTYVTDNKSTIISYYTTLALVSLSIGLVIMALLKGISWVKKSFFGGRKKR